MHNELYEFSKKSKIWPWDRFMDPFCESSLAYLLIQGNVHVMQDALNAV